MTETCNIIDTRNTNFLCLTAIHLVTLKNYLVASEIKHLDVHTKCFTHFYLTPRYQFSQQPTNS
jgi:hypothetical protein